MFKRNKNTYGVFSPKREKEEGYNFLAPPNAGMLT